MRIYYYHTRPIAEALEEWKTGRHPGHILYGLPLFNKNGVECILHRYKPFARRWALSLYNAWEILRCGKPYDILYGTSFRGLEIMIFLRALHLYGKPIVIWHHQAVTRSSSAWKERFSQLFYKGIDMMFFFSKKLINDSLESGKATRDRMHLIHWGPDLAFYDDILECIKERGATHNGFISTGKENRDMDTLLHAFTETGRDIDIFITKRFQTLDYERIIRRHTDLPPQTRIHFTGGILPYELALKVAQKSCVVICSLDFPYTVGLTTLVEAMALGMPVICSRNPNFEFDIDREGIGLTVAYGDTKGWAEAVEYIATHPDEARLMGQRGRKLAEERFNLELSTKEIVENFKKIAPDYS